MPKAKYQYEDFLSVVRDDCKGLVSAVHETLLQKKYKPKLQVMKSTGLQLSYAEPKIKGVIGIILLFFIHESRLMIRIYGKNHANYPDVLNRLSEKIVNQIDKADDCKKFIDPQKCWTECMGYDFRIKEKRFRKCLVNCFQLEVDSESMLDISGLIESESKERCAAWVR